MTGKDTRTFLGFEDGFVAAVARTLLAENGKSLGPLVIVVPGRRAGRKLLEALTQQAQDVIVPPRIVTEAGLARELSAREWTTASPALVECAWLEVLANAQPAELEPFVPAALPGAAAAESWAARVSLARQLAALDRELAPLEGARDSRAPRASARRVALARLSRRVQDALGAAGLVDPAHALQRVRNPVARRAGVQVVLAGVVELPVALRAVLESLVPPPRVLIHATEDCAAGFDALGGIESAFWEQREIPLADHDWLAVDDAAAAIASGIAWIQRLPAETTTDEVALGLPGAALLPGFAHALAQHGLPLHSATGTPVRTSAPWLALDALHAWIVREDFSALAAALRHPAVEHCVRAESGLAESPAFGALLDAWHARHLPDAADGELPGDDPATAVVRRLRDALRATCAEIASDAERALSAWLAPIVELLCKLYPRIGGLETAADAFTRSALERFAELAHDQGGVGDALSAIPLRGDQALRLWLDWTADEPLRDAPLPGAVEALGWLELALEEAPWMLLVGLNDGWVAESRRAHPLLGPEDEAALAESARTRLARDVHALTAIALQRAGPAGRHGLLAVSLRRGVGGDPLRPSRLLFHAPDSTALARAKAFYTGREERRRSSFGSDAPSAKTRDALQLFGVPELRSVAVSRFKAFLKSPYLDYLEHVLKLERVRDDAWELDPREFGSLVHKVLEDFGLGAQRDETREEPIAEFLRSRLRTRALARFGPRPLPAVRLQLQQLDRRFDAFARVQAAEARAGWRIDQVERTLEGAAIEVDGVAIPITGRVDRIDRHEDGRRWRILDYKTGDDGCDPRAAHVTRNGWRDLQLPLYRHFLRERLPGEIRIGYFAIPRTLGDCNVYLAELHAEHDREALELAEQLLRRMRDGDFAHVGGAKPTDRVQRALCGLALLSLDGGEASDEETAFAEESG